MIDCKYQMKECLLGKQEFGKAVLLWLSRKKGKRESSSGSGEEREGEMVCSAPVRRGVKEDRKEGKRSDKRKSILHCRNKNYVAGW